MKTPGVFAGIFRLSRAAHSSSQSLESLSLKGAPTKGERGRGWDPEMAKSSQVFGLGLLSPEARTALLFSVEQAALRGREEKGNLPQD